MATQKNPWFPQLDVNLKVMSTCLRGYTLQTGGGGVLPGTMVSSHSDANNRINKNDL